jgi:transcriptional regulator with XRE-family HTH domain
MAPQIGRSRLPELLKQKRTSQSEFARRIDVSESFVSQIIRREADFSILTGKRAADFFGCTIDDLYEWIYD